MASRSFLVFFCFIYCYFFWAANANLLRSLHETELNLKRDFPASCVKYVCSGINQPCFTATANSTASYCHGGSVCTSGTCTLTPLAANGASCSSNSECQSGLCVYVDHSNSGPMVCNAGYNPGTPCTADSQCALEYNWALHPSSCVNNRCIGLGIGQVCSGNDCTPPLACAWENATSTQNTCFLPKGEGAWCISDLACNRPFYCNYNTLTCTQPLAEGDFCDRNQESCPDNTMCSPTTSVSEYSTYKCIQAFTGAAGAPCQFLTQCGEHLTCIGGQCVAGPVTNSFRGCYNYTTCDPYEECICNYNVGPNGNPPGICTLYQNFNHDDAYQIFLDYTTCISQCGRADLPCIYTNCVSQICVSLRHAVVHTPNRGFLSFDHFPKKYPATSHVLSPPNPHINVELDILQVRGLELEIQF